MVQINREQLEWFVANYPNIYYEIRGEMYATGNVLDSTDIEQIKTDGYEYYVAKRDYLILPIELI